MEGVFITGTDTDVGKTTVAAGLMKMLHGFRQVRYWKPLQTGTLFGDDTATIQELTELGDAYFAEPLHRFPEPAAPLVAARKWHKQIEKQAVVDAWNQIDGSAETVLIEASGGLLVPIGEHWLQSEFIAHTKLPTILVAEDRLGAINQTLMTLKICEQMEIPVLGVILTKSRSDHGNESCIREFGNVEILASLPFSEDARGVVANIAAHARLRELMGVAKLP
jgi:dethiobiotin synthase